MSFGTPITLVVSDWKKITDCQSASANTVDGYDSRKALSLCVIEDGEANKHIHNINNTDNAALSYKIKDFM